jgi:hypothetical protein
MRGRPGPLTGLQAIDCCQTQIFRQSLSCCGVRLARRCLYDEAAQLTHVRIPIRFVSGRNCVDAQASRIAHHKDVRGIHRTMPEVARMQVIKAPRHRSSHSADFLWCKYPLGNPFADIIIGKILHGIEELRITQLTVSSFIHAHQARIIKFFCQLPTATGRHTSRGFGLDGLKKGGDCLRRMSRREVSFLIANAE